MHPTKPEKYEIGKETDEAEEEKITISSITTDFFEHTNMHGLGHIPETADRCIKFTWFLLFCCGIAALTMHIKLQVDKYNLYPLQVQ